MPRQNELPRNIVAATLTDSQLSRLDELSDKFNEDRNHTLIAALAVLDVMVKSNVELTGETVFTFPTEEKL